MREVRSVIWSAPVPCWFCPLGPRRLGRRLSQLEGRRVLAVSRGRSLHIHPRRAPIRAVAHPSAPPPPIHPSRRRCSIHPRRRRRPSIHRRRRPSIRSAPRRSAPRRRRRHHLAACALPSSTLAALIRPASTAPLRSAPPSPVHRRHRPRPRPRPRPRSRPVSAAATTTAPIPHRTTSPGACSCRVRASGKVGGHATRRPATPEAEPFERRSFSSSSRRPATRWRSFSRRLQLPRPRVGRSQRPRHPVASRPCGPSARLRRSRPNPTTATSRR